MELKQLQYFLTVAEHLNFSRAAESLYISQPTLSYQIAELERELGAPLFIRDRRKVFLTHLGGAMLPLARRTLDCAQEIRTLAQNGVPEEQAPEPLCIAFDKTEDHFESTGVTQLIARFEQEYPAVGLELCQLEFDQCVKKLLLEELDLAFLILRHNEHLPTALASKPVHRDRLMLVLKKDATVHNCADALRKYSLVTVEGRPRGESRILRCFENMGVMPNLITSDSIPVSFTYVQSGRGAIFLPGNYFRQHHYDDLMALDIPDSGAELTHVVAWSKSNPNSSIQYLVNSFAEVPPIKPPLCPPCDEVDQSI